jgi:hypothetical protein
MEADISIWRKTGHFYFALTRKVRNRSASCEPAKDAVMGSFYLRTRLPSKLNFG